MKTTEWVIEEPKAHLISVEHGFGATRQSSGLTTKMCFTGADNSGTLVWNTVSKLTVFHASCVSFIGCAATLMNCGRRTDHRTRTSSTPSQPTTSIHSSKRRRKVFRSSICKFAGNHTLRTS